MRLKQRGMHTNLCKHGIQHLRKSGAKLVDTNVELYVARKQLWEALSEARNKVNVNDLTTFTFYLVDY